MNIKTPLIGCRCVIDPEVVKSHEKDFFRCRGCQKTITLMRDVWMVAAVYNQKKQVRCAECASRTRKRLKRRFFTSHGEGECEPTPKTN